MCLNNMRKQEAHVCLKKWEERRGIGKREGERKWGKKRVNLNYIFWLDMKSSFLPLFLFLFSPSLFSLFLSFLKTKHVIKVFIGNYDVDNTSFSCSDLNLITNLMWNLNQFYDQVMLLEVLCFLHVNRGEGLGQPSC